MGPIARDKADRLLFCLSSVLTVANDVNDTVIATSSNAPLNLSAVATTNHQSFPLSAQSTANNPTSNSEFTPSDISGDTLSTSVPTETNNALSSSNFTALAGDSDVLSTSTNTSHQAEHIETPPYDVTMGDALLPPKPCNDKDLPEWLVQMVSYLCNVAEDTPWQDLVTSFVKFKKGGPPIGVSFLLVLFS